MASIPPDKPVTQPVPLVYHPPVPLKGHVASQHESATSEEIRSWVRDNEPRKLMAEDVALKGRDRAMYTRQQKGHSLILHLTLGGLLLWIPAIYITASKNHFWHA